MALRSRSEYGEAERALFLLALMLARKLGDPSREAENISILIFILQFLGENHCAERKNNWFLAASNDPEIIICSFHVLTFMKYFPYLKLELSCQTLENMKHCSDHTGPCSKQLQAVSNPKLYFLV